MDCPQRVTPWGSPLTHLFCWRHGEAGQGWWQRCPRALELAPGAELQAARRSRAGNNLSGVQHRAVGSRS